MACGRRKEWAAHFFLCYGGREGEGEEGWNVVVRCRSDRVCAWYAVDMRRMSL